MDGVCTRQESLPPSGYPAHITVSSISAVFRLPYACLHCAGFVTDTWTSIRVVTAGGMTALRSSEHGTFETQIIYTKTCIYYHNRYKCNVTIAFINVHGWLDDQKTFSYFFRVQISSDYALFIDVALFKS